MSKVRKLIRRVGFWYLSRFSLKFKILYIIDGIEMDMRSHFYAPTNQMVSGYLQACTDIKDKIKLM